MLLGVLVCVLFVLKALCISRNQFYSVMRRVESSSEVCGSLRKGHRFGISFEEVVCGWLHHFADLHDPQPDKPYTILAYKRKSHVYAEYVECAARDEVCLAVC